MNPLKAGVLTPTGMRVSWQRFPRKRRRHHYGFHCGEQSLFGMGPGQVKEFPEPLGVWVPEPRLAVDAYQVLYRTADVHGRATTATTLIVQPRGGQRRFRPALWWHGGPTLSEAPLG